MSPVSKSIENLLEQAIVEAHQNAQVQIDILDARLEESQERCAALESQLADEVKNRKINDETLAECKKILTEVQKKCDSTEKAWAKTEAALLKVKSSEDKMEIALLNKMEAALLKMQVSEDKAEANGAAILTKPVANIEAKLDRLLKVEKKEVVVEKKAEPLKIRIPTFAVVRDGNGRISQLRPN